MEARCTWASLVMGETAAGSLMAKDFGIKPRRPDIIVVKTAVGVFIAMNAAANENVIPAQGTSPHSIPRTNRTCRSGRTCLGRTIGNKVDGTPGSAVLNMALAYTNRSSGGRVEGSEMTGRLERMGYGIKGSGKVD